MKKITLLFALFVGVSFSASAQILRGQIQLHYGKKLLKNVQVSAFGTSPQVSNDFGQFELHFPQKNVGDKVKLMVKGTHKGQALEVVDTHDLDCILPKNPDNLRAIYMCYAGQNPLKIEANFKQKAQENFEIALKTIEKNQKLTLQEKNAEIKRLNQQLQSAMNLATTISERMGAINLMDMDTIYQQAFRAYLAGDFEKVNQILSLEKLQEQEQNLDKNYAEIQKQLETYKSGNQKLVKEYLLKAQTYLVQYDLQDSAVFFYEKALSRDSTNLEILQEVADFYHENHRYQKAFALYPKIIAHPEAEAWQKANAYGNLGQLYTTTGDLEKALEAHTKYYEIYQKLLEEEPERSFYQNNLAISYEKLGSTHSSLGNLDKALTFFEKDIELTKELYEAYPNNVSFKNGLAISYYKLYQIYLKMNQKEKAKVNLEQAVKLFGELKDDFPSYAQFTRFYTIAKNALDELEE